MWFDPAFPEPGPDVPPSQIRGEGHVPIDVDPATFGPLLSEIAAPSVGPDAYAELHAETARLRELLDTLTEALGGVRVSGNNARLAALHDALRRAQDERGGVMPPERLREKAAAWDSIPTPHVATADQWREAYIDRMREIAELRREVERLRMWAEVDETRPASEIPGAFDEERADA